jgi:RNA polymerase sigma factor (sigma-70 family)
VLGVEGAIAMMSEAGGCGGDGASERLARIYREERGQLVAFVRRRGVPAQEVEDCVQDVFIVLQARLSELDTGTPLRAWLRAVAWRMCRNRERLTTRRQPARTRGGGELDPEEMADAARMTADQWLLAHEQRRVLVQALRRLDAAQREVLLMATLEERTAAEIGELTRTSPNTVSSRLRAARKRMCAAMQTA